MNRGLRPPSCFAPGLVASCWGRAWRVACPSLEVLAQNHSRDGSRTHRSGAWQAVVPSPPHTLPGTLPVASSRGAGLPT